MKANSRHAYTMVEVIVSAVVFIVAAGSILATVVQTRQPAIDSDENAKAAMYAQKVSETLRSAVGADTWNTAAWSHGVTYTFPTDTEFPGYTATYTVTDQADGGKQVLIDVTY